MLIFIENKDQSIRFSKPYLYKNADDYFELEKHPKYFIFIQEIENKYNVNLQFYGIGDEIGYIIEEDIDKKTLEKIFGAFTLYLETNWGGPLY